MNYPCIMMKVQKDLYRDESGKISIWKTKKCENFSETITAGTFLAFRNYWYSIINPVTEEDKKNSITIIMNKLDAIENQKYPLGRIEIHPYELNELIKEDAIEII